jgi:hypothetical protein
MARIAGGVDRLPPRVGADEPPRLAAKRLVEGMRMPDLGRDGLAAARTHRT